MKLWLKLVTPDYITGKMMMAVKSRFDILTLLVKNPSLRTWQFARLVLKMKPFFTMVTTRNLSNLYGLVERINQLGLPGDIVECGVWNGGSAAIMGASLARGSSFEGRRIWLFDSFQGLPPPGEKDGQFEKKSYFVGWNKGDPDKVKQAFRTLSLGMDRVVIVPGWFQETLVQAKVKHIALLHIDADWYDSVKTVLEAFYPKVVPGGFIKLDDYGYWTGCRQALDDYFFENGIEPVRIYYTDRAGAYFVKPKTTLFRI